MSSPLCGVRWFGSSSFARSAALGAAAARAVSAATCPASGKTFLACALGQRACRHGYRASYWRTPRLVDELTLARADGTLSRLLAGLARVDLLIIDDWGITPLRDQDRRDLFEVVEDRDGSRSTLVASQIPISGWHVCAR